MSVLIEVVQRADEELIAALNKLIPQLSGTTAPLDLTTLTKIVNCASTGLLVARIDGLIVGTLTFVLYTLPTGARARIEDVVVDEQIRNKGVATALVEEAIRLAREGGARTIDLTSRPTRIAANHLYEKLGFQVRNSTIFRYILK